MLLSLSCSLINSESSAVSADSAHSLQVPGVTYNNSTHNATSTPKLQVLPKPRWGRHTSGRKGQVVESEVLVYIGDDGSHLTWLFWAHHIFTAQRTLLGHHKIAFLNTL